MAFDKTKYSDIFTKTFRRGKTQARGVTTVICNSMTSTKGDFFRFVFFELNLYENYNKRTCPQMRARLSAIYNKVANFTVQGISLRS
jgi:hypothetical protein